jgi:hypothetical protein
MMFEVESGNELTDWPQVTRFAPGYLDAVSEWVLEQVTLPERLPRLPLLRGFDLLEPENSLGS